MQLNNPIYPEINVAGINSNADVPLNEQPKQINLKNNNFAFKWESLQNTSWTHQSMAIETMVLKDYLAWIYGSSAYIFRRDTLAFVRAKSFNVTNFRNNYLAANPEETDNKIYYSTPPSNTSEYTDTLGIIAVYDVDTDVSTNIGELTINPANGFAIPALYTRAFIYNNRYCYITTTRTEPTDTGMTASLRLNSLDLTTGEVSSASIPGPGGYSTVGYFTGLGVMGKNGRYYNLIRTTSDSNAEYHLWVYNAAANTAKRMRLYVNTVGSSGYWPNSLRKYKEGVLWGYDIGKLSCGDGRSYFSYPIMYLTPEDVDQSTMPFVAPPRVEIIARQTIMQGEIAGAPFFADEMLYILPQSTGLIVAIPSPATRNNDQAPAYLAKGQRVFTDGVLSDTDGVPFAKDADGLYTVPLTGKYLLSYYNSMTII